MSGGDEQERDTSGRRGWWLVGALAVIGAAAGAFAGYRLDPDVKELAPALAVAGFGLGGLIGVLLLVPFGLWRAWRRRALRRRAAAAESVRDGAVEAPATEEERPEEPVPEEAAAPTSHEQPEPEPPPPPPDGEEPGWYPDPRDGVRRYWDGHTWTGHVWGGRTRERTRKRR